MMPPVVSMKNNDDAFFTLLSAQRELLNRLNTENVSKREQAAKSQLPPKKRGSILGSDSLSLMNRPMMERRASLNTLRRLSIGMGNDNYIMQSMFDDAQELNSRELFDNFNLSERKMMRRRSTLGLLSSLPFDDFLPSRRLSIISSLSEAASDEGKVEQPLLSLDVAEPPTTVVPYLPMGNLRTSLEGFAFAMEKSAKSQQDIHNWDQKMGLKRSHSKTMRLSMRSRKKLRSIMKKEIMSLVAAS